MTENASRHRLRGGCHCGALGVVLDTSMDPRELPLRACQCSFCRQHGARAVTDPAGRVVLVAREPDLVGRYHFGLATADFFICARCGVYVAALFTQASQRRATLNANALAQSEAFEREAAPVTYESETAEVRVARRVERWTPATLVECRRTRADAADAASVVGSYLAELDRLFGGFDARRSVSAEPDELAPPSGTFLMLLEGDQAVACGGLKTHAPGVGEIKRMFVLPEARARGLGRVLLEELEREARALGMARVVLDTAAPLAAAAQLYRAAGFEEVPPFNDNPYAAHWFAKELTARNSR